MKAALVVDDDVIHGKGIMRAVNGIVDEIYFAESPHQAIAVLAIESVQFILTEINYDTIESIEYINKIIALEPNAKVFAWSASIDKMNIRQLIKAGVAQIFEKPLSINKLANEIKKYL